MIVISGALVLVALVLLILGVVGPDLAFVYASIGVSLVSLGFLVVGILQRRDEPATELGTAPATRPATEPEAVLAPEPVAVADPVQGESVRPSSVRRAPDPLAGTSASGADEVDEVEAPVADTVDVPPAPGGSVLVVQGRPRYHVAGCRYLSGKTPEVVEVVRARDEGFTPCGVCKPDLALAALAQGSVQVPDASEPLPAAPARSAPVRACAALPPAAGRSS